MNNFNPHDWLPEKKSEKGTGSSKKYDSPPAGEKNAAAVEAALQAIETSGTDLTASYSQWMEIGFALADEFGEGGREYFHRVSKFHPEYSQKECDEKYSNLLKSKGSGIGIGTFFHYAKQVTGLELRQLQAVRDHSAPSSSRPPESVEGGKGEHKQGQNGPQHSSAGSEPADAEEEEESLQEVMPVFPDSLYANLPHFLQRVVAKANSPEERDLLLLGTLAAMSACFPKLYGIYHGRKVHANLYLFVTAPASAGKGRLSLCRQLVLPIHMKLRNQAKVLKLQYAHEMAEYNQSQKDKEKPVKPPERMLFIPANNSSTGAFQLLADNEGRGLIFETEGDTLSQSFKSDHGNYSDGFRKAYHHETISYYRRADREYVDIEAPCLSAVLSGTPKQVTSLIPSAEDGLFSRFVFYYMNLKPVFQDVFANDDPAGMDAYYSKLGKEFLELYESLNNNPPLRVVFTQAQKESFVEYFENLQTRYLHLQPQEYVATVRRLGLNAFRMAMILTALRIMEDGEITPERSCQQVDFDTVITMSRVLIKHSSSVYNRLPEEIQLTKKENLKERFLDALPYKFTTRDFHEIAGTLKIAEKTASRYITQFVKKSILEREGNGRYRNPAKEEEPTPEEEEEEE